MKWTNRVIKIVMIMLTVCLICPAILSQCVEAKTINDVLSSKDRKITDNTITLCISGVKNFEQYDTNIYYEWTSPEGNDSTTRTKNVEFAQENVKWKYEFKLPQKGTYRIKVQLKYAEKKELNVDTKSITVKYDNSKPEFSLKGLPQLNIGGHTYQNQNYYDFWGSAKVDGNTYYYKSNGAKIGVVVYEGSDDVKDIQCKIEGKTIGGGSIARKSGYASKQFTINGEVDGQVSFIAINNNGITGSKYAEKTIVVDMIKPVIKIDDAYASKSKTIYKNKSVRVPITITEKHFDSGNTKVLVNGKNVSVFWNSSGEKNTANVKLEKGEHVISVTSTDKAGNVADEVKSAKIIIDTTAPKVKISGIDNGKSYGNRNDQYTEYKVDVKIEDKYLSGNKSATLYKMNESTNEVLKKIDILGSRNGETFEFVSEDIKEDGYYKLIVKAKDKAGNNITEKSLNKQGEYKVSKGEATGYFYINRNGSKYEIDESSAQFFNTISNSIEDVVIYEYNVNQIKQKKQQVSLITTLEDRVLSIENGEYTWEDVSREKGDETYPWVYKYTIKQKAFKASQSLHEEQVFQDGLYSIKINSKSDVIGDGKNNSLKVESSNDSIMNQIIIVDAEEPEVISMKQEGNKILIHVRDNNFKEDSAVLLVDGKKKDLKLEEDLSTSTNIFYTCEVSGNVTNVNFICSDKAGNNIDSTKLQIVKEYNSLVWMITLLIIGVIVLISVTVVTILVIKSKK